MFFLPTGFFIQILVLITLRGGEVTKDTMMVIPLLVSIVTTSQE